MIEQTIQWFNEEVDASISETEVFEGLCALIEGMDSSNTPPAQIAIVVDNYDAGVEMSNRLITQLRTVDEYGIGAGGVLAGCNVLYLENQAKVVVVPASTFNPKVFDNIDTIFNFVANAPYTLQHVLDTFNRDETKTVYRAYTPR